MSSVDSSFRTGYTGSEFAKAASSKKSGVQMDDFFKLFASQLQNQDFMNPMDNSQFLTQMAQFQSMQAMQNLSENMNNSLAIGMIGKTVVCADYNSAGALVVTEAEVEKVSLTGGEIRLYLKGIKDKSFTMDKIMEVKKEATLKDPPKDETVTDPPKEEVVPVDPPTEEKV
ncbi:MAG: flagellar hook capping FlgD N-terminal domain-containing protein [Oscillospiraceae bacterium]